MKHILIDYENIRPTAEQLDKIDKSCCIWLLLDFYLAYYLGKITAIDNEAIIYILSNDSGYDVLVDHLQNQIKPYQIIRVGEIDATSIVKKSVSEQNDNCQKNNDFSAITSLCFREISQYLITPNVFQPTHLKNLINGITNRLLPDELSVYDERDRKIIIKRVINRLSRNRLITVTDGIVTYHTSATEIRKLLVNSLINSRPNSVEGAKNILRSKMKQLGFEEDKTIIEKILQYCRSQQLFKQNNQKLIYPPFPVQKSTISKNPKDTEIMEKINKRLFKAGIKNQPNKLKSLKNMLKSSLQLSDTDSDKYISLLLQNGKINISATNKITYN